VSYEEDNDLIAGQSRHFTGGKLHIFKLPPKYYISGLYGGWGEDEGLQSLGLYITPVSKMRFAYLIEFVKIIKMLQKRKQ